MPYGILKADTITYYTVTGDVSISVSGIAISGSPLISGASGIFTTIVSGATVTGNTGQFTTVTGGTAQFTTVTGGIAQFTSVTGATGVFTSSVSGATVTGNSGQFTTVTAVTGVFTTSVSGTVVSGGVGSFTTISGDQAFFNTSVSIPSGSAAAPSISFNGDANTGIYSPGADQVAVATNGTGRLFVDASGSVGINKSPAVTIDTQSTGSNCTLALNRTDAATAGQLQVTAGTNANSILSTGTKDVFFSTNSTERLRITSAGLVGIGTSAPSTLLHLSSATGSATPTPTELRIATTTNASDWSTTDPWGRVSFYSNDTSGGGPKIHAAIDTVSSQTSGPDSVLRFSATSGTATLSRAFEIRAGGAVVGDLSAIGAAGVLTVRGTSGTSPFVVRVTDSEVARIDSSGRLLVGTSSAVSTAALGAAQVQVVGTDNVTSQLAISRFSNDADRGRLCFIKSRGSSGTNTIVQAEDAVGRIEFLAADGSGSTAYPVAAHIGAFVDGTPGTNDMPGRLVFSTTADGSASPTERMRIAQNGVITIQNGAVAVIDTLTDGANITPDFAAGCNFTVTLGGNRTLDNPTNLTAGQSGSIFIVQDGTGSRLLSFGSSWDFTGGTAPTLSTGANAVDRIDYVVRSGTSIHTVFTANYS